MPHASGAFFYGFKPTFMKNNKVTQAKKLNLVIVKESQICFFIFQIPQIAVPNQSYYSFATVLCNP